MPRNITLTATAPSELDWILRLEREAREEGFIRGNDKPAHQRQMESEQGLYLTISADNKPVGFVILANIKTQDRNVELARIIIDQRERGVGQLALKTIIDFVFSDLGAHRIWLDTLVDNTRGQHIYEKLGFVEEGRQRQALNLNGTFHDIVLYGLLASEWTGSRSSD